MIIQIDTDQIKNRFLLTDQNDNELDWGVNYFPDGQIQFWCQALLTRPNLTCSITNPYELDLFYQMNRTFQFKEVDILYLYGARSDKRRSGEKHVCDVGPLTIEMMELMVGADECNLLSPHCHSYWGLHELGKPRFFIPEILKNSKYTHWIFPDQSAYERFGNQVPEGVVYVIGDKKRNQETGEIIEHVFNWPEGMKRALVVDDLCDGGKTFLNIAELTDCTLDLYVTHGVFSNNAFDKLRRVYANVFCTNSYKREMDYGPILFDVWEGKGWRS